MLNKINIFNFLLLSYYNPYFSIFSIVWQAFSFYIKYLCVHVYQSAHAYLIKIKINKLKNQKIISEQIIIYMIFQ